MKLVGPIGARLQGLRRQRRWTQGELAQRLGVSQPRLSQIENGDGALSVEQFLRVLELFNVGVEHFAQIQPEATASAIQNALARLGARHLAVAEGVAPSSWSDAQDVVAEVLTAPESPRHIAALAPVVVAQVARLDFQALAARLALVGRARRVGWLAANLRSIFHDERPAVAAARRAATLLELFAASAAGQVPDAHAPLDILDADIRSLKSARQIFEEADDEAQRWRIVTRIGRSDFLDAWRAARSCPDAS